MVHEDLTGQRFGRLVVVQFSHVKSKQTYWLCKCDCGNTKVCRAGHLRYGATKSCGCLRIENTSIANSTHGMSKTRLYGIWQNMLKRTEKASNHAYADYGGRGIRVCDAWHDFTVFMEWSLLNGYAENLTIDRIDVNGDYEPSNCRWITMYEQAGNKRNTIKITLDGQTKTLVEWCKLKGCTYMKAYKRYRKGKSPIEIFA